MNKLSNKSIEKFKIFLEDEEFSYISLTRHEFKILFNIYNSVIPLISEAEEKENRLTKYLEEKMKDRKYANDFIRYTAYKDVLERVKSGKYDS